VPKQDIESGIRKWLESSGYPLEMFVAEEFRRVDFRVSQSTFYSDPETKLYREIDVVASSSVGIGTLGRAIRIQFAVECKSSRDKPWVMFTERGNATPRETSKVGILSITGNPNGKRLRLLLAAAEKVWSQPLFSLESRPAYGMVQALGSKGTPDASYAAQMQAAKATIALSSPDHQTQPGRLLRLLTSMEEVTLAFAVIVLDGRLFTAALAANGNLELKEKKSHFLAISSPEVGENLALVNVVTKDGLANYVSKAAAARDAIFAWCKENVDQIEEALKKD